MGERTVADLDCEVAQAITLPRDLCGGCPGILVHKDERIAARVGVRVWRGEAHDLAPELVVCVSVSSKEIDPDSHDPFLALGDQMD